MTDRKQGKSIRIFLADGDPNGLRIAELSNWIGQAVLIPRNRLKEARNRGDCQQTAVYFLIGEESETSLPFTVYIGEAEDLSKRLDEHNKKKEFWEIAIGISSKDLNLTKAHVMYLESRCIEIAREAKRVELDNSQSPKPSKLPEADEAWMEEFLENLKLLLASVGYKILEKVVPKDQEEITPVQTNVELDPLVYCKSKQKGVKGVGRWTSDGFVVYADSTAVKKNAPTTVEKNKRKAKELLEDKIIESKGEIYEFVKDFIFGAPSGASSFILGNASNGWDDWKTEGGDTLDEIYRSGLEGEAEQGSAEPEGD